MSVREIPAAYEFKCDVCGAVVEGTSNSRPTFWGELNVIKDAHDYQGCAVADGSVKRLLCEKCLSAIGKAVNDTAEELRAAAQKKGAQ